MRNTRLRVTLGAGLLVLAMAGAACNSNNNNSTGQSGKTATGAGAKGGTLYMPMESDFEHLDPARSYVSVSLNFGRLLYRTLTTYKAAPGKAGLQITGDLATDTGQESDGGKTWTFKLKQGIKFEDGREIGCQDVRYGVERAFDPDLPEGPQYIQRFLANVPPKYQGPKKSGADLPDTSLACTDNKTIVFHLNRPVADFGYTVAEPTTAPVPKDKDNGTAYDNRPFSSGPYKIQSYARGKELKLVRNTFWDAKTDTVRKAYPDAFDATFGNDPGVLDQRFIANAGKDQSAIQFDSNVQPQNLTKVLTTKALLSRTTQGLDGFTFYLGINTKKVTNLKVRQALEYAVNKETYRAASGGKPAGDFATAVSNPNVLGHQEISTYQAPPTGDVAKAKQLLSQSGVKLPLNLTLAVSDSPTGQRIGVAVQQSLARANIKVNIQQQPRAKYYTIISDSANEPDLVNASWGADWPSLSTVLPPLFDGRQIQPQGNQNYAQLNVPAINKEMDRIQAMTDVKAQQQAWGALEKTIMDQAPVVPTLYNRAVFMAGSKVKNTYMWAPFGGFDLVSLSVK
jgi:peptide/nickel transport system substrate-binding protein